MKEKNVSKKHPAVTCVLEDEYKQNQAASQEIKDSPSAINEMSMAALFALFHQSHGPLLPLMNKMNKYQSFGQFLAEADHAKIREFIPELSIELISKK